jgi:hypothetical protein
MARRKNTATPQNEEGVKMVGTTVQTTVTRIGGIEVTEVSVTKGFTKNIGNYNSYRSEFTYKAKVSNEKEIKILEEMVDKKLIEGLEEAQELMNHVAKMDRRNQIK